MFTTVVHAHIHHCSYLSTLTFYGVSSALLDLMAISEADFAAGRVSPGPFQHKRRPSSPVSSTSLNHIHLAEALLRSEDNGATLDLSHRNLTDVGEYGAEELAAIGREDLMEDESSLLRYVTYNIAVLKHELCHLQPLWPC